MKAWKEKILQAQAFLRFTFQILVWGGSVLSRFNRVCINFKLKLSNQIVARSNLALYSDKYIPKEHAVFYLDKKYQQTKKL